MGTSTKRAVISRRSPWFMGSAHDARVILIGWQRCGLIDRNIQWMVGVALAWLVRAVLLALLGRIPRLPSVRPVLVSLSFSHLVLLLVAALGLGAGWLRPRSGRPDGASRAEPASGSLGTLISYAPVATVVRVRVGNSAVSAVVVLRVVARRARLAR